MISAVASLLMAHLAAGGLAVAAALALSNRLPDSFLRFCAVATAISAIVASYLSTGTLVTTRAVLAAVALLWYVWLGLRPGTRIPALLALAASAVALGSECIARPGMALCVAGAVSSALLIGSVAIGMVLGHWYLIVPGLSIQPLRHGTYWFCGALVARWIVVVIGLIIGGWEVLRVSGALGLFLSALGLFFVFRVLTGLVAPVPIARLTWRTVHMRSTQSATGLLYIAIFFVMFGELISQFLTITTGFPL